MIFLSVCWLIVAFAIFVMFALVSAKSLVPKQLTNLYLFGKVRGLEGYRLSTSFLQVPKRWFSHFYFAGILCNSVYLYSALNTYVYGGQWSEPVKQVMTILGCVEQQGVIPPLSVMLAIVLMEVQVTRRFLECIMVNSYSSSTMSIVIYMVGVMFYSFIGLSVLCQAPTKKISLDTLTVHWYQVVAVLMFCWASYKQYKVNKIFAKLRQDKTGNVENSKHHIPHGDLFELCSCPHYLMEIMIYTSLNVLFLGQHEILLCILVFVVTNQVISAIMTHSWYKQNFPNYPKDRKALIPYIF